LSVPIDEVVEIAETIKTLILEIVSGNGACHIREIHLQVTGLRPEVPQPNRPAEGRSG
jgi:uncharacterized alkaline shock family protein YloU